MDYFKTNWTQKMKINPVANRILNGKPQPDVGTAHGRRIWKLRTRGPLSMRDLWQYSTAATRPITQAEHDALTDEQQDYRENKYGVFINAQDFLDEQNKKPHRRHVSKKYIRRKRKKQARKQGAAIQHQGQQQQQQGQAQDGEERQQEVVIDITGIPDDNAGNFENVNDAGAIEDEHALAQLHKQAFGQQAQAQQAMQNQDVAINNQGEIQAPALGQEAQAHRALNGDPDERGDFADEEKGDYDIISIPDDDVESVESLQLMFEGTRHGESGYWDNTYVKDYINIHHPKLLPDYYIQALKGQPLIIKPPSVFFSHT